MKTRTRNKAKLAGVDKEDAGLLKQTAELRPE
jgi:hypothetical protein